MINQQFPSSHVLLSVEEMTRADTAAAASGVASEQLMERAGAGVTEEIIERWSPRPTLVLCGPGNNGGDGFVVARLLKEAGWSVRVSLLGSLEQLKDDAKQNAERWSGPIGALEPSDSADAALVVDALFGAGLSRPVEGAAAEVLLAIDDVPCVAVDIPSGIDGNTGAILGVAAHASLTVTFFRRKPGHLLLPGRIRCGEVVVKDIGIPESVLSDLTPELACNHPDLWRAQFPWPRLEQHKYSRGLAVIAGGVEMTGAARMAVLSAQRSGVGIVTLVCAPETAAIYRVALTSAVVQTVRDTATFVELVDDPRTTAWLVGPGAGATGQVRERVLLALRTAKPAVLDADALAVFEENPELLFEAISGPCLITPHEGEFKKLFQLQGDKVSRAQSAAKQANCVVLLKGADTVIAHPDGRAVINSNAPADLATAGAGDVLAGIATGLISQGMGPFDAACAAAWLQGAAANEFGSGLIAEDLIDLLPTVLRQLKSEQPENSSGRLP